MGDQPNQSISDAFLVDEARTFFVLPFVSGAGLGCLPDVRDRMETLATGALANALDLRLGESEQASLDSQAKTPIWQQENVPLSSEYFHDFVKDVFGNLNDGEANDARPGGLSLPPLRLSDTAINLLNGGFSNRSEGLAMDLRRSGIKRLNEAGADIARYTIDGQVWLRFEISDVRCIFFGTGVGMLVIQIEHFKRAKEIPAVDLILESSARLARAKFRDPQARAANIARYRDVARSNSSGSTANDKCAWHASGLGHLAALLLTGDGSDDPETRQIRPIHWEKAPVMVGVRTKSAPDPRARALVATRLARKQTSAYLPCIEGITDSLYRPFEPLTHAVSIEGGAILVETNQHTPEHIGNFLRKSLVSAYLPLMLWAMHEYLFLTELMRTTSREIDFDAPGPNDLARLKEYRTRIYNYRLHFRYSHASTISMHNHMFNLWRETYDLATILNEMNQDVSEIDAYLSAHAQKQKRRQDARLQTLTGVVVFLAGALIALPDWIGTTFYDIFPNRCSDATSWFCHRLSLHHFILGLATAFAGIWFFAVGWQWLKEKWKTSQKS